jgi:deoxyribonuclease-4
LLNGLDKCRLLFGKKEVIAVKIGSHVSISGKGLLAASKEAAGYGSSTFMIYTGAPQNTIRKKLENLNIEEGFEHMKENGLVDIVVHAPYIINLASFKPDTFELAVRFLKKEIERTEALGSRYIVLHPGSHTGKGEEYAIERIAEGLNEVLIPEQKVFIALETMAGKGSEVAYKFEHIAEIMNKTKLSDKLAVCMDTCHMHDAGYDVVGDFDGVINEFDDIVGLDRLKVFHINDSKNPRGARKDRHENIGLGHIGFDALSYVVHHEALKDIPKILETPYVGEKGSAVAPYKHEIEMLREKTFEPTLKGLLKTS